MGLNKDHAVVWISHMKQLLATCLNYLMEKQDVLPKKLSTWLSFLIAFTSIKVKILLEMPRNIIRLSWRPFVSNSSRKSTVGIFFAIFYSLKDHQIAIENFRHGAFCTATNLWKSFSQE
jgi:hypothetical protein